MQSGGKPDLVGGEVDRQMDITILLLEFEEDVTGNGLFNKRQVAATPGSCDSPRVNVHRPHAGPR